MNETTRSPFVEPSHNAPRLLFTIFGALVFAFVVGASTYVWQQAELKNIQRNAVQQISLLQSEVTVLKQQKNNLEGRLASIPLKEDTILPTVVYARGGLLTNTPEGQEEKEKLETLLVEPFIDYYNDDEEALRKNGSILLTINITVPEEVGEPYNVEAIFSNGEYHGFLFGEREGDYDYWEPECMGECVFSEEYKTKYPHVVKGQ